jgi:hypothetical protein
VSRAGNTAAAYAALRTAAAVADHWVQSGHQAVHKADAGLSGHRAMAGHVGSYAATQAVALVAADRLLGMDLKPSRIAAAVALSAATHWFIDRGWPVKRAAIALGKQDMHDLGCHFGGRYQLDQSAHHLFEGVAAVIAAR